MGREEQELGYIITAIFPCQGITESKQKVLVCSLEKNHVIPQWWL